MKKTVSIIVIEYNSLDEIYSCIQNIRQGFQLIEHEIIVSSNSVYSEDKKKSIEQKCFDVKWIFNKNNNGFAYAMNRGLEVATGKYLVISNSDIVIKQGMKNMIDFFESHKEIGAIAPQIVDKSNIIQDSCRPYITVTDFITRHLKRFITNKEIISQKKFDYNKIQTVDWVIGAFIMVKRDVYKLTQGLDEQYFLYVEDMDWCVRIRQNGYEIVYFPNAVIEYAGTRAARNSFKYAKIFTNSIFRYWKKFGFFYAYPKRNIL
jgi:GT2 family glycosyltransferase